eukprot:gnl/TRDRNA2_/TRDRNA2_86296_c3_seq1.p1 gnl/TRDRNA2_/TRDRNA2_86296_c3~~gnl/TRDRNA2_/TRDRNA2_86296_c3_seq1.p1  ORF type:complete len:637 (+),score=143.20 gnl/TRDRNA2_/TRDRNA2_86296_c3_seq1:70-1980(+)
MAPSKSRCRGASGRSYGSSACGDAMAEAKECTSNLLSGVLSDALYDIADERIHDLSDVSDVSDCDASDASDSDVEVKDSIEDRKAAVTAYRQQRYARLQSSNQDARAAASATTKREHSASVQVREVFMIKPPVTHLMSLCPPPPSYFEEVEKLDEDAVKETTACIQSMFGAARAALSSAGQPLAEEPAYFDELDAAVTEDAVQPVAKEEADDELEEMKAKAREALGLAFDLEDLKAKARNALQTALPVRSEAEELPVADQPVTHSDLSKPIVDSNGNDCHEDMEATVSLLTLLRATKTKVDEAAHTNMAFEDEPILDLDDDHTEEPEIQMSARTVLKVTRAAVKEAAASLEIPSIGLVPEAGFVGQEEVLESNTAPAVGGVFEYVSNMLDGALNMFTQSLDATNMPNPSLPSLPTDEFESDELCELEADIAATPRPEPEPSKPVEAAVQAPPTPSQTSRSLHLSRCSSRTVFGAVVRPDKATTSEVGAMAGGPENFTQLVGGSERKLVPGKIVKSQSASSLQKAPSAMMLDLGSARGAQGSAMDLDLRPPSSGSRQIPTAEPWAPGPTWQDGGMSRASSLGALRAPIKYQKHYAGRVQAPGLPTSLKLSKHDMSIAWSVPAGKPGMSFERSRAPIF